MSRDAVTSSPAYANKGHALCASPLSFAIRYSYLLRLIATISLANLYLFFVFYTVDREMYGRGFMERGNALCQ